MSLAELIATQGVIERVELAGRVGVMALHGGLETGTAEAAAAIAAGSGASLYTVVQPDDLWWHVPSVRYDPRESANLTRFLEFIGLAVSLHGFGRRGLEDAVLVGGRNRRAARVIASALRRVDGIRVIDDVERMPARLRGLHRSNPVNLPEFAGVQLELSPQVREGMRLAGIADAVVDTILSEQRSLCVAG
jgi:phage replication-related protein YjqB (UPF0714/DUF867 family)